MANLEVERPYSELQNPDFELVGDAGQMLGWQPRIGSAGSVDLAAETAPVTGRSLHLKSEDALGVAVQSHLFPIPSTGQMTVRTRVRGVDLQPGSQLYAWFEYQSAGATRQRYVALGAQRPVSGDWQEYEFAVDDLPLASSGQMRIQFHLVGQGEAWIDDVRLYDLRFSKEQRYQISKRLYAAKTALEDGQLMDCQRLIDGYWPRLFVEQAPIASIASKPTDVTPTPKDGAEVTRRESAIASAASCRAFCGSASLAAPGSARGSVTMQVGVVPRCATPWRSQGLEIKAGLNSRPPVPQSSGDDSAFFAAGVPCA